MKINLNQPTDDFKLSIIEDRCVDILIARNTEHARNEKSRITNWLRAHGEYRRSMTYIAVESMTTSEGLNFIKTVYDRYNNGPVNFLDMVLIDNQNFFDSSSRLRYSNWRKSLLHRGYNSLEDVYHM